MSGRLSSCSSVLPLADVLLDPPERKANLPWTGADGEGKGLGASVEPVLRHPELDGGVVHGEQAVFLRGSGDGGWSRRDDRGERPEGNVASNPQRPRHIRGEHRRLRRIGGKVVERREGAGCRHSSKHNRRARPRSLAARFRRLGTAFTMVSELLHERAI